MNNDKPFLHIATDEKFINTAYETYEKAFPGQNTFVILISKQTPIKYLSSSLPYIFISISDPYLVKVEKIAKAVKYIIYHSFTWQMTLIFSHFKTLKTKNVWSVFGYEMHSHPYLPKKRLFGDQTYQKYNTDFGRSIKNILRPIYYFMFKYEKDPYLTKWRALNKMDYVAVLYEEEFEYFKKVGGINNAQYVKFTYAPIGVAIPTQLEFTISNNILLGNSASYTNNHIEIFNILNTLDIGQCQIITPLSYGSKDYAEDMTIYGKILFGDKFKPLRDFLPIKEYQAILQNCGIVIMNHYRQQALGNILHTLYAGAKVYLSKKNTLYHYLNRIGCHIYSVEEDLIPENTTAFELLSSIEMEQNRAILYDELNMNRICKELQINLPL